MLVLISYVYDIFFSHASWLQVFQHFQFLFVQVKMVNDCEGQVFFQDNEYQL